MLYLTSRGIICPVCLGWKNPGELSCVKCYSQYLRERGASGYNFWDWVSNGAAKRAQRIRFLLKRLNEVID